MSNSGTITITARTPDLAREALADWQAEHPYRVPDRVAVTLAHDQSPIKKRLTHPPPALPPRSGRTPRPTPPCRPARPG